MPKIRFINLVLLNLSFRMWLYVNMPNNEVLFTIRWRNIKIIPAWSPSKVTRSLRSLVHLFGDQKGIIFLFRYLMVNRNIIPF